MEHVTITLSEQTKDDLEGYARRRHAGDREAAVQALLAEWIEKKH